MHVFINATSARTGGGITVLKKLIPGMLKADDGQMTYTVVARPEAWAQIDPGDSRVNLLASPAARFGVGGRIVWEQLELPLQAIRRHADVMISPANVLVPLATVPQVLIYQNMAPHDPAVMKLYKGKQRLRFQVLKTLGIFSGKRAKHVVFISEYAKTVIGGELHIASTAQTRIYLGKDENFSPSMRDLDRLPAVLHGRPFLLSVSHFYRYKNFVEMVRGFAKATNDLPRDVVLAIAGGEYDRAYADEVKQEVERLGLADRVKFLGNVPYADLPALYASASMFIFPSACENFPNILVEGMSSGVPTLASSLQPMPEIAGDGAIYFNPHSPEDLATAILKTWNDPQGAAETVAKGIARSSTYSWDRAGREMVAVVRKAAG